MRAHWSLEVRFGLPEGFVHHVWPDGCISLVVVSIGGRLIAASVLGPGTRAQRVPLEIGAVYRGVRFWPDAGGMALDVDPASLRGRIVPLAVLLGGEAVMVARGVAAAPSSEEAARVFDAWLSRRLAGAGPLDTRVRDAVESLIAARGELPVSALARRVGLGPRQFQRRFRAAVGLTPKEYARVCRGRAALAAALRDEDRWSVVAATLGYADQAHLVRDVGVLMGLTPGALRERLELIEHGPLDL